MPATRYDLGKLKEAAKKAEETLEKFDSEDLFRTLVDPFLQIWQERNNYGKEAAHLYAGGEYANVQDAFEKDFLH